MIAFSAADVDGTSGNGNQPPPEGLNTVTIRAGDAIADSDDGVAGAHERSLTKTVKIDRTGPSLGLSGPLYDGRGTTLAPGDHALAIDATDGVPGGTAAQRRSGVKQIGVEVDGSAVLPAEAQGCSTDSCPLSRAWTLETGDYAPGSHTVTVTAEDHAGNVSASSFEVTTRSVGTLVSPRDDDRTARYLSLQARSDVQGHTGVRFQYRRTKLEAWSEVPLANLTDEGGQPLASATMPLNGQANEPVIWDVPATFPLMSQRDGPIFVRAVFAGGDGGMTRGVQATLQENGLSTDDAREGVGPGTVDLVTGNFAFSADDVSVESFAQALTVSRTFNSRDPDAGPDGPFGAGWTTAIPIDDGVADYESLREVTDPYGDRLAELKFSDGSITTFLATSGGGWEPEEGFESLSLSKDGAAFVLKDIDGNATRFEKPATTSAEHRPVSVQQPGSANKTTYAFEPLAGGKSRVTRVVAPSSANCSTLGQGCRALQFVYAPASTPVPGGDPGAWGDYGGRLVRVDFTAWDPEAGQMVTDAMARYAYDDRGRLRAAWDPRISPALKETYAYDGDGRLVEVAPPGEEPWSIGYEQLPRDVEGGRLRSVSRSALDAGIATTTVVYDLATNGPGAPYAMGPADVAAWAQTDRPVRATAIFPPDQVPGPGAPASFSRATVHYLNADGRAVNTVVPGGHTTTSEHDEKGNVVRELSASNRARALAAGGGSAARSRELDTQRVYDSEGLELREELGPQHAVELPAGGVAQARAHTVTTYDEGSTVSPAPHLPTTVRVGAQLASGGADADVRMTRTEYDWALRKPTATISDAGPGGLGLVDRTVYDPTTGLEVESRMPRSPEGGDASATRTVYYSAAANSAHPECGGKRHWENLVCKTLPAAQPTSGLPELPATTFTYTRLNQVRTQVEQGAAQRTTTMRFDGAGRLVERSVTASEGEPVAPVTTSYDPVSGNPTTVTSAGGTSLSTAYDSLGRPTAHTDSTGNTSTTSYDLLSRPLVTDDGKGTQTRSYDPTSGLLTGLEDSDAGSFTAAYDPDGAMTSRTLPNGLTASTAYDEAGVPVGLRYRKSGDCTTNCTWFEESVRESVHGQWLSRESSVSDQRFAYDGVGRLTEVRDTSAARYCTARSYVYDANSNRRSMVERDPAAGGACDLGASGKRTDYAYDEADRLTGNGVTYDGFGRTTALPGERAGGGALSYIYFANDMVRRVSQDGVSKTYELDPMDRHRQTVADGESAHREVLHYADSSDAPAWTQIVDSDGQEVSFSRSVEGIDGDLAAIAGSESGVELQLTNLHGDVIATATTSPEAIGPTARFESDEFGNPMPQPGEGGRRFGWLGGKQRRTELPSGVIQMGVRSYVPALGRFTTVDPVEGGSANDYDYTNQDPTNTYDLDGRWPDADLYRKVLDPCADARLSARAADSCFPKRRGVSRIVKGVLRTLGVARAWLRTHRVLGGLHGANHREAGWGGFRRHVMVGYYRPGVKESLRRIQIPFGRRYKRRQTHHRDITCGFGGGRALACN